MGFDLLAVFSSSAFGALMGVAVGWGVIKTELRFLRRDVNSAHRRLDKVNAPSSWSDES